MKQKIAVMLIMIMTATIMFSSFAYAEADNKVGIKIEFDKKAYVKGETAAATLTLTGLSDEKDAGRQLGAFETHLKFDKTKLTYKASNNRGVYTFCMCPGGYVVNSSSEKEHLVINGMSNYRRDSKNANSAVIVTVTPDDFGTKTIKPGKTYTITFGKKDINWNDYFGKTGRPDRLYIENANNVKISY